MVKKSIDVNMKIESLISDCQEYDRFGRNMSEQRRRQNKIQWTKVKYNRGRLVDKGPI